MLFKTGIFSIFNRWQNWKWKIVQSSLTYKGLPGLSNMLTSTYERTLINNNKYLIYNFWMGVINMKQNQSFNILVWVIKWYLYVDCIFKNKWQQLWKLVLLNSWRHTIKEAFSCNISWLSLLPRQSVNLSWHTPSLYSDKT